uniref:Fibrinogen C-terminal domain-containing protein n=1 Tax=Poecilia latipinna TaxID=48699 RepID=A0A3B3U8K9_9TELE
MFFFFFFFLVPAPPTHLQVINVTYNTALLRWTPSLGKVDRFIVRKLRFPFPTECSQELLNGALESGEVTIYPQGKEGRAVRVYCDMETDGGGWTVQETAKTFTKTWSEYKAGFGNLSEEFWLGNELLHNLTSIGPVSLRVDLESGNDTAYARYANFSVASEGRNYTLTVSGYTGTAGDSMKYHNGRPFSTRDKEPDPLGIHCAKAYVGGWWYKNCYKVNLNGLYGMNSNNQVTNFPHIFQILWTQTTDQ